MKILATADLHVDLVENETEWGMFRKIAERAAAVGPDVLIHAGDLAGFRKEEIRKGLELFAELKCTKLAVPGNHELWLREGDSYDFYRNRLPGLFAEAGFHMLDTEPVVLGTTAFVGNVGWYDLSFRDASLSGPDEACYQSKRWPGRVIWNDGPYVRLGRSDAAFCEELRQRIESQIRSLPPVVATIVAVTHHVAFAEMANRPGDDEVGRFCAAFSGSAALGRLLIQDPRIRYHICGHTHAKQRVTKGHVESINVGSTYEAKRFAMIELSGAGGAYVP
jgi:3',5'-cyclic AMP phosphodiesterase CpdA